ncbi:hypothetical protein EC991_008755 [Linnemannia zychae]|nr:hypothetical protein EC991_008755 [Linnemannia zychae]
MDLTKESVVWSLTSVMNVNAFGLITFSGVDFNKNLTLLGMNGFNKITIKHFDLPSNAPDNLGAVVKLVTHMNNPSQIGITLGSIVLDLFYEGTHLGQVTAQNATILSGESESPLELEGVLYRQTLDQDLEHLSTLMSNYLGGRVTMTTARGVSVKPDGVNPVSWLSNGIMNLTLSVPLQSLVPLQTIHEVKVMDMGIAFNPATPYVPTVLSKSMTAGFKIPFNITVKALSVANSITLGYKGKVLGDINGSAPSQANSNIPGLISFELPPSPLEVKEDAYEEFNTFLADLTFQAEDTFLVFGKSNATVETPMGVVALTDVPFNSPVTMKALNFNTQQTTVSEVQVIGGTSEHVIINVVVTLTNPSSLTVGIGNVTLMVNETTTNQFLGDLIIQNLTLVPSSIGPPMRVAAQFLFHPTDTLVRDHFLSRFVAGDTFPIHATGSPTLSSPLPELQKALSLISLDCSVAGLIPPPILFPSGHAISTLNTVLGSHQTAIWVNIQNPLQAAIFCTSVSANITWRGDYFGTINQSINFLIPDGQGGATTPELILQHPQDLGFSLFLSTQFLSAYPGVAMGGGALVPFEMEAELRVKVGGEGGYEATIRYKQRIEILVKMTVLGINVGGVVDGVVNGVVGGAVGGVVNGVVGEALNVTNGTQGSGGSSSSSGGGTGVTEPVRIVADGVVDGVMGEALNVTNGGRGNDGSSGGDGGTGAVKGVAEPVRKADGTVDGAAGEVLNDAKSGGSSGSGGTGAVKGVTRPVEKVADGVVDGTAGEVSNGVKSEDRGSGGSSGGGGNGAVKGVTRPVEKVVDGTVDGVSREVLNDVKSGDRGDGGSSGSGGSGAVKGVTEPAKKVADRVVDGVSGEVLNGVKNRGHGSSGSSDDGAHGTVKGVAGPVEKVVRGLTRETL